MRLNWGDPERRVEVAHRPEVACGARAVIIGHIRAMSVPGPTRPITTTLSELVGYEVEAEADWDSPPMGARQLVTFHCPS